VSDLSEVITDVLPTQPLSVVPSIEMAVVAAAALAIVFYRLKQPALLAYIAAGLVLGLVAKPMLGGSLGEMEEISHLGLVFLLFIIGVELDLKGILKLGPRVAAAVMLQAPITIGAVWGLQLLLDALGLTLFGLATRPAGFFIFAVAVSLSSTAVVVKLLGDRFDLGSQAGRITVLTLIAQDIWAVLSLTFVTSQGEGSRSGVLGVVFMLGGAAAAVAALWLVAHHLLTRLMRMLSRSPDMVAMAALGWCFVGAGAMSLAGLSAEMGALIAGLTLGSLPIAAELLAKVSALRDFFMALFFVALGMSLPLPTLEVLGAALALIGILLLSRLVLFSPLLLAARLGPAVSFASAINLAQLSEFSLLLLPIGVAQGALTSQDAATVSYALMLSVVLSTYGIKYNYPLAFALTRLLRLKRAAGDGPAPQPAAAGGEHGHASAEVVMLGYFRNAESLAERLAGAAPDLLARILVVDYNLKNHPAIQAQGLKVVYGDISNPETLRHHGIQGARVVLSTVTDNFLRGTSNLELLKQIKGQNPEARFIGTAISAGEKAALLEAGAYACISPSDESAAAYLAELRRALAQGADA